MLVVIVASGATVRLTGSGLGCEHWPGCQAGDPFPKTGYHSFIEFSNRIVAGDHDPRRRSPPSSPRSACPGVDALGALGRRRARSLGTLAAGAARGDHRPLQAQPVARRLALPALDRRARARRARRARGVERPRRAGARAGLRDARGSSSASPAARCSSRGVLATAAGPHSGGVDVPRVWKFEPAVYVHVRATADLRRSPFLVLLAWLGYARQPAICAARSSCSGCSSSR